MCLNVVVYKNQCHLIALCYKRCGYEGLEEQGCAENKNPNSIKIRCLVIFDSLDRLVGRQTGSWVVGRVEGLGKDTNGQKEMVNE